MPITKTTDLTNSVVAEYKKEYFLLAPELKGDWAQFIDWQAPISENGGGGSSIDFPVYGEQDPVESALTEDEDVNPATITDGNVVITPDEWGKVFAISKKSRLQSRTNIAQIMAKLVNQNRVKSIDRVLRRSATGRGSSKPTQTLHIDGSAAMADLTCNSNTDRITYAWLMELSAYAASMDIEPFENAGFICLAHPLLIRDIKALNEWVNVGYYQDKTNFYSGTGDKPISLAGITFIPSNMGRIHLGAGTALQAATTLNGNFAAGETKIIFTDATGIVAGNYVTIGTLETYSVNPGTNLEQVYIVNVNPDGDNANEVTIRANGKNDSFGLRFNHLTGESVVEAYNVASVPLIGKNSLLGVYSSDAGKYGKPTFTDAMDYMNGRMQYYGWWWYGGVGVVQKRVVLGKCAVSGFMLGYN